MKESSSSSLIPYLKKYIPDTSYKTRKMALLSQPRKNGEVKVYIEVIKYMNHGIGDHRKKTRRLSTEVWVHPKNWSKNKQEVLSRDDLHKEKNAFIEELHITVMDYLNSRNPNKYDIKTPYEIAVNIDKLRIDFEKLFDLFPPVNSPKEKGLIEYFDDYIKFRKERKTVRGTLKEFITVKNRLMKFDEHRKKRTMMRDIDLTWSDQFETFLLNEINNGKKKGYSLGTIDKSFTVLVTVLYHFYKRKDQQKIIMTDEFQQKEFKRGEKSKNEANPLNIEQFTTLFNHKFEKEYQELTKKRFCLQCTTGLRFGDIDRIRPKMINNDVLTIIPHKSLHLKKPKSVIIPLNKYAKEILNEFNNDTSSLRISNQPYNRNLADVFKIMREKYPDLDFGEYSSHDGRDTFISRAVEKGVDFKTILEWTAQSSYTIVDRYIKTTEDHKKQKMKETWDI